MADEKPDPKKTQDALEQARRGGTPIPLAELRFASPNGVELPGSDMRVSRYMCKDGRTAEYWPWIRHFRLAWKDGAIERSFFVPESWASWTPAA